MIICKHCKKIYRQACRPRGLCYTCYYTHGVREQYPVLGDQRFQSRGVHDFFGVAPLPTPTEALPGSPEKLQELARRAEAGMALWHPRDARHL